MYFVSYDVLQYTILGYVFSQCFYWFVGKEDSATHTNVEITPSTKKFRIRILEIGNKKWHNKFQIFVDKERIKASTVINGIGVCDPTDLVFYWIT